MAVKIIKDGELSLLKETIEFKCDKCGCVFTADKDDYMYRSDQSEGISWYQISCPYCSNWVIKDC